MAPPLVKVELLMVTVPTLGGPSLPRTLKVTFTGLTLVEATTLLVSGLA